MIKIITTADKRPDFIKVQYDSFNKFILDKYEYVVANNGSNPFLRHKISTICKDLKIKEIKIPWKLYKNPAFACGEPIQYIYDNFLKNDNFFYFIDSDMFLISKISFRKYVGNFSVLGVHQKRGKIDYLWNGIIIFKNLLNGEIINFLPGCVEGEKVDVGGHLYYWLKKTKPNIKYIKHSSHICKKNKNLKELPKEVLRFYKDEYNFEIYDKKFLHYSRGSNWKKESKHYHIDKTKLINKIIYDAINEKLVFP